MTSTERYLIIGLYFVGFVASLYLGMRIEFFRARRRINRKIEKAYDRGWDAGYGFVGTIHDRRVDMDSAIRVLTGEEADSDRPFPRT